jgi:excisionase family DNA binding protein
MIRMQYYIPMLVRAVTKKYKKTGEGNKTRRLTVTIEEAAGALGIGRNSAYAAAHAGQIPTIRLGKRLLVSRAALQKMLSGPTSVSDP